VAKPIPDDLASALLDLQRVTDPLPSRRELARRLGVTSAELPTLAAGLGGDRVVLTEACAAFTLRGLLELGEKDERSCVNWVLTRCLQLARDGASKFIWPEHRVWIPETQRAVEACFYIGELFHGGGSNRWHLGEDWDRAIALTEPAEVLAQTNPRCVTAVRLLDDVQVEALRAEAMLNPKLKPHDRRRLAWLAQELREVGSESAEWWSSFTWVDRLFTEVTLGRNLPHRRPHAARAVVAATPAIDRVGDAVVKGGDDEEATLASRQTIGGTIREDAVGLVEPDATYQSVVVRIHQTEEGASLAALEFLIGMGSLTVKPSATPPDGLVPVSASAFVTTTGKPKNPLKTLMRLCIGGEAGKISADERERLREALATIATDVKSAWPSRAPYPFRLKWVSPVDEGSCRGRWDQARVELHHDWRTLAIHWGFGELDVEELDLPELGLVWISGPRVVPGAYYEALCALVAGREAPLSEAKEVAARLHSAIKLSGHPIEPCGDGLARAVFSQVK